MVTINATLLIELVLFLLFLWGTQRFILTPALKNIDEREEGIEQDRVVSESNTTAAEALEQQYRHDIAVIRRDADEQIRVAQQKSQHDHAAFLMAERVKAEQALAETLAEAQRVVESQRDAILAEIPDLAKLIHAKLVDGGAQ